MHFDSVLESERKRIVECRSILRKRNEEEEYSMRDLREPIFNMVPGLIEYILLVLHIILILIHLVN